MWYQKDFFKYPVVILLILLILYLLPYTTYLMNPLFDFIAVLFFPLALTGILYYALRPIVRWLVDRDIYQSLAILIVYFAIFIIILLFISYVIPIAAEQIGILTELSSETYEQMKNKTANFMQELPFNISLDEIRSVITTYLYQLNSLITDNILSAATMITRFAVTLVITPFMLYYFLKDDLQLYMQSLRITPRKHRNHVKKILAQIDSTLSTYIIGQLLVSFCMGMLLLVGYWWIGLKSAIILALFAMLAVVIPFFGVFIALIPALIVALAEGPWMVSKVLIVVMIAQTIEANFVSPQIMSHRLHLHPLTVMLLLLASGSLYGVVGLFVATPLYAVIKAVLFRLYNMYYLHEEEEI